MIGEAEFPQQKRGTGPNISIFPAILEAVIEIAEEWQTFNGIQTQITPALSRHALIPSFNHNQRALVISGGQNKGTQMI